MARVLPRPPLAAVRAEPMLARQLHGGEVLAEADGALLLLLLFAIAVEECGRRRRQTGRELARESIAKLGEAMVDGQPREPESAA